LDKDLTGGGWEAKAERRQGAGGRTLEGNRIEGGWRAEGGRKEGGREADGRLFLFMSRLFRIFA